MSLQTKANLAVDYRMARPELMRILDAILSILNQVPKLPLYTVAALPTGTAGNIAFATNGRKAGEGAGLGTGVLAFHDGTAWRACDTGATVAA